MDKRGLLDLIIARIPELTPREKISLYENFASEEDFIRMGTVTGVEAIIARKLKNTWNINDIRFEAEHDARIIKAKKINLVTWIDAAYPPLLREIFDPPAVIFYQGQLPNPEKPLVAVVGTRNPSPQAFNQAYTLSQELGRRGISVISGLALGIDTIAHRANLEGGGATCAVFGSGVDEVYPHANRLLARHILETGGSLISEYPPGTSPFKWNFPARNRIISGMARGVVIVEAPESSGALITAQFALDQNRDLWVASTGADATMGGGKYPYDRRGSIKLVENGARIITDAQEVLAEWNIETAEHSKKSPGNEFSPPTVQQNCGKALAEKLAQSLDVDLEGKMYGSADRN